MNKEQQEEYNRKRSRILAERDSKIKQLETEMEREYYQKIDQCQRDISSDPKKQLLQTKLQQRKQQIDELIKAKKSVNYTENHQQWTEIESISSELKNKYHCNVDPLDIVMHDNGTTIDKNAVKAKFSNEIEYQKKKVVKPIVQDYIKILTELDQQYKSNEPKPEIRFIPVLPSEIHQKRKTTKRTTKK